MWHGKRLNHRVSASRVSAFLFFSGHSYLFLNHTSYHQTTLSIQSIETQSCISIWMLSHYWKILSKYLQEDTFKKCYLNTGELGYDGPNGTRKIRRTVVRHIQVHLYLAYSPPPPPPQKKKIINNKVFETQIWSFAKKYWDANSG